MFPALNDGDRLLVRRCHGNDPDIVLGDVVLVVRPDERTGWRGLTRGDARTQGWFVKRVAAEPEPSAGLFLVGDHPRSMDSRQHGPCPRELVAGVVLRKIGASTAPVPASVIAAGSVIAADSRQQPSNSASASPT